MMSTRQVGTLVGASFRQLDHWSRKGYVGDPMKRIGSGHQRSWSSEDIRGAYVLTILSNLGSLHAGVNYRHIDEALQCLSDHPERGWLVLEVDGVSFVVSPATPKLITSTIVECPSILEVDIWSIAEAAG